ncbi:MAG: hypothetical protein HY694_00770 [Deltaproteobacteria bacterium]|nr:hypothetical protein [Deltaproteobacteria bacterium]
MKKKDQMRTVRRSVALPRQLVEDVSTVAPPELRQNLNRLVTVALQEFAAKRKERAFEEAMSQMAADPAIQAECAAISREFTAAETDGLKND